jgi:hypothetical protein
VMVDIFMSPKPASHPSTRLVTAESDSVSMEKN